MIGVVRSLKAWQAQLLGKRVLCLGSGGAARAVAYALGSSAEIKPREFVVCSKTVSNADKFVRDFQTIFPEIEFRSIASPESIGSEDVFSLVVNATPLGMKTSTEEGRRFFKDIFKSVKPDPGLGALAFDLI